MAQPPDQRAHPRRADARDREEVGMTDEVEVESYEVRPNEGLFINGDPFPYYVLADGPMVEPMDPQLDLHILWLPLICKGSTPPQGRPEGDPLPTQEHSPEQAPTEREGADDVA